MLLKGAAAGKKFNEMADRLKGIYKNAAKDVEENDDLNKFYQRLRSLTADQISWMEMVLYPDTVGTGGDGNVVAARKLYESMYKCSIGKWMRSYNYKTRQYKATEEAEKLQRALEKADYETIKTSNGYNKSVFDRLPCTFLANVFDETAKHFFNMDIEFAKMMEVVRDNIPITTSNAQPITPEERAKIVESVESGYWENIAKLIVVLDGQFRLELDGDILTFAYDQQKDQKGIISSLVTSLGNWWNRRRRVRNDTTLGVVEYKRRPIALGSKDKFRKTMETNLDGWKPMKDGAERKALEQLMDFLDAHPQTGNYQWWRDRFGTPMSIGV